MYLVFVGNRRLVPESMQKRRDLSSNLGSHVLLSNSDTFGVHHHRRPQLADDFVAWIRPQVCDLLRARPFGLETQDCNILFEGGHGVDNFLQLGRQVVEFRARRASTWRRSTSRCTTPIL